MEHCRRFLAEKNPGASRHAAVVIEKHLSVLENNANEGRPLEDYPDLRELIIPFGESGYVVLYRCSEDSDEVFLLPFRHQKEAGY